MDLHSLLLLSPHVPDGRLHFEFVNRGCRAQRTIDLPVDIELTVKNLKCLVVIDARNDRDIRYSVLWIVPPMRLRATLFRCYLHRKNLVVPVMKL